MGCCMTIDLLQHVFGQGDVHSRALCASVFTATKTATPSLLLGSFITSSRLDGFGSCAIGHETINMKSESFLGHNARIIQRCSSRSHSWQIRERYAEIAIRFPTDKTDILTHGLGDGISGSFCQVSDIRIFLKRPDARP